MSLGKFYDTDKAKAARDKRFGTAGDPQRQGRIERTCIGITSFDDRDGRLYALLGVTIVGEITVQPAGAGFIWSCFLPGTPRMQRAADLSKAMTAVDFKVREWCAAAGVVVSAAALQRLKGAT